VQILPERIEAGTLGFGKAPAHLFDETASDPGSMSYRGSESDVAVDNGAGAGRTDTMLSETARRVGTAAGKRPPSLLSLTRADSADATSFLDRIDEDEVPTGTKAGIAALKLPVPQKPTGMPKLAFPETSNMSNTSHAREESPASPYPADGNAVDYSERENAFSERQNEPVPEELKELLTTLSKKTTKAAKEEFRNQAKTRVLEQAYLRCLNGVETGAHMDDATTGEALQLLEEWRRKTSMNRTKKHEDALDLRKSLDSQIAHNSKKAEETRLEHKNGMISFILPGDGNDRTPAALAMVRYDENGNPISSRHVVSKILEDQIAKNAQDKERQRKQTLNAERAYLDRLAAEIELHNAMDRTTHLEKQRSLLEAWERDGHIRNLKKLQPFGVEPVQDYIQRNLVADPFATATGPLNYTSTVPRNNATAPASMMLKATSELNKSSTLAGKLNMSIGYDPRRPKLEW
jgi:hypothetical protein